MEDTKNGVIEMALKSEDKWEALFRKEAVEAGNCPAMIDIYVAMKWLEMVVSN